MTRTALLVALPAAFLLAQTLGCRAADPGGVRQFGEMRAVMRGGDTEPRVSLSKVAARPGAIAVGALADLAGEITIFKSQVWVARPEAGELHVTGPTAISTDQATLLTVANVENWDDHPLPLEGATSGKDLEDAIRIVATNAGLDLKRPFPFVITTGIASLELHVINGYCPIGTDPATMNAQPWKWSSPGPVSATIVGFFALDSAGVMTHHGTSIHAHAIVRHDQSTITGHIDRFALGQDASIRLPSQE